MAKYRREMQGFAKSNTGCERYDGSVPMMEKQNEGGRTGYVL